MIGAYLVDMNEATLRDLRHLLDADHLQPLDKLRRILRVSARHRAQLVANTLVHFGGLAVRAGPFAGMTLPALAAEGCFVPKLLGCYEAELHPSIERIRRRAPANVVNVGCAEGYYAVGLARVMPDSRIWAYDTDENARAVCARMAGENGVSERITLGGTFEHADFARFPAGDTVVICDIEGAELALLDPEKAPALAGFDIQVELHNKFEIPLNTNFIERFTATHEIDKILPAARDISTYPELRDLEHLDQLLAFWEFRRGPNPWLFMTAKPTAGQDAMP